MIPDELRRSALGWVLDHRQWFALPGAPQPVLALKPLGELGLTADLVMAHEEHRADARSLLELAWTALDRGDRLARAALRQPAFVTSYPSFHRRGFRNQSLDQMLVDPAWLAKVPRVPLQLPVEAIRRAVGCPAHWDLAELLAETAILPRHPRPGSISDFLVYSLTHTVFLLTDYGADPGGIPDRDRAYLRETLPAWLELYRQRGNVDIVAELIMTGRYIGEQISGPPWDLLARARQPDGSLLPIVTAAVAGSGPEYPDRFLAVYHSTLVAIMASSPGHSSGQ